MKKIMLDYADYVKKTKSIIVIKPKPPFMPIFQVAATKGGSKIRIINEPLRTQSGSPVVFLVETGEGASLPAQRFMETWMSNFIKLRNPERVGAHHLLLISLY